MLRKLARWNFGFLIVLMAACSKGDESIPPINPKPDGVFTISELMFHPDKIPIKTSEPTFSIAGTLNYKNASDGVKSLRLTSSAGFDTTLNLQGLATATNGTIVGDFILTRPDVPVQFSFEVALTDGKGRTSNKLSGAITIAIDDSGMSWYDHTIDPYVNFNDLGYFNDMFVAVTSAGTICTSPDGIHWGNHILPNSSPMNYPLRGITFSGSQYIAVGDNGTIFTSPNGIDWTNRSLPENENFTSLYSVASNADIIVAVGENAVPVGRTDILTSIDGISWTRNSFSLNFSGLRSVIWTGNRFVAVGFGILFTSLDGVNWTDISYTNQKGSFIYDVIQSGEKTIAIGTNVVAIGDNDGNWTWHNIPDNVFVYSLAWSGNKLIGVGNGIFTSNDGLNWTQRHPGNNLSDNYECVVWGKDKFVAAGKEYSKVTISP